MGGYGQRVELLTYYSGGRIFAGADTFYVVAMGIGGCTGVKVKIIAIEG